MGQSLPRYFEVASNKDLGGCPMRSSQTSAPVAKSQSAVSELNAFIEQRRRAREPVRDLEEFERELGERFRAAQAETMGEELSRFDVDTAVVEIDGVPHRRVLRSARYDQKLWIGRVRKAAYPSG
jgi:hypothetical protein